MRPEQNDCLGMRGALSQTRELQPPEIVGELDDPVPEAVRRFVLPALKGLPSRHPRISLFLTALDDRHRIPHISTRLRRRKSPLCQA
jgi:hypothetical protein